MVTKQLIIYGVFPVIGIFKLWLLGQLFGTIGSVIRESKEAKRSRIELAGRIFAETLNEVLPILEGVKIVTKKEPKKAPKTYEDRMDECVDQWEKQERLSRYTRGVTV